MENSQPPSSTQLIISYIIYLINNIKLYNHYCPKPKSTKHTFMRSSCYKDNHFYLFLQHVHVTRYKIFSNFQIIQVIPIKIKTSVPNHPILIKPHHHVNPYTPIQFNGWVVLLQSVILIKIKITGLFYSILINVNHPLPRHNPKPFNGTPKNFSFMYG